MAKAKKHVERFEVSKVRSGKGKHAFKVTVHHHPTEGKEGKGMKHAFPEYHRPEEHMHPSHHALHRHMKQLVNDMSVEPGGDDDGDEIGDGTGQPMGEPMDTEPSSDEE